MHHSAPLSGHDGAAAIPFGTFTKLRSAAVIGCAARGCTCTPEVTIAPPHVTIAHDDDCPALRGAA